MNKYQIQLHAYDVAQNYYEALKNRFTAQIETSSQALLNRSFIETRQTLQQTFGQTFSTSKRVETQFSKLIAEIASGPFRKDIANAQEEIARLESEETAITEENRKKIQNIRAHLQQKIRTYLVEATDAPTILYSILKKTAGREGMSHETLHSLYLNFLTKLIMNFTTATKAYINASAVSGFYQEIAEAKAWKKLGKQLGFQVLHGGELKLGGRETPIDIVLGAPRIKKIQVRALEDYERTLSAIQNMNISEHVTTADFEAVLKELNIKTVGIQSKLKTLQSTSIIKTGYQIGNRKTLLDNFLAQKDIQYTQIAAANYFGSDYRAIIEALGATNLIWTTGNDRMFMDDFIKAFRNQNLLLSFAMQQKKLIATVKLFDENQLQ